MKTILYHVGFSIDGNSGKSRATAQKVEALRGYVYFSLGLEL